MESKHTWGLIGMLLSIGALITYILCIAWLVATFPGGPPIPTVLIIGIISTILFGGGLVVSIAGLIKGSLRFGIPGIIVSIIMGIFMALFWYGLSTSSYGGFPF